MTVTKFPVLSGFRTTAPREESQCVKQKYSIQKATKHTSESFSQFTGPCLAYNKYGDII